MIKHLDLQLFAEGEATPAPAPPTPAATPATTPASTENTATSSSTPAAAPAPTTPPAPTSTEKPLISAGDLEIYVNPQTGRREIRSAKKAETQPQAEAPKDYQIPAAPTSPPANNPIPGQQEQPKMQTTGLTDNALNVNANKPADYSPQELAVALQLGVVDEARVPAQYKPQYETYKAARQAAQQPPQQQAQAQQQPNAEQDRAKQIEFYKKLDAVANQNALQEIGITAEDLDNAEYSDDQTLLDKVAAYKVAKDWHKNNLISEVQARTAAAEQQQAQQQNAVNAIYGDKGVLANFVTEAKAKEPNFDKIDVYMNTRYQSLPFEQARPIAEALNALKQRAVLSNDQLNTLEKYYNETRIDFYAQNNNISTAPQPVARPAVVETPGGGGASTPAAIDYSELRNADFRGKQAFIAKLFASQKQ